MDRMSRLGGRGFFLPCKLQEMLFLACPLCHNSAHVRPET
jgi:hypothetical protein